MKDRSTLLNPKDYTEKQIEHIYQIWLYTYGGAGDVVSLDRFVNEFQDDPDVYGSCPCYICQSGEYDNG